MGAEVVIRTRKATDWPEKEPVSVKLWRAVLFFVPRANPDYDKKMHLLHEWWIEFDAAGDPGREIGLDAQGKPVLAGPDERNYGFWLDTNMTLKDFERNEVDVESFEAMWSRFFAQRDLSDIKSEVECKANTWSGPPRDNLESWQDINSFIEGFPDDVHWSRWKPMARSVVGALEARGLAPIFRIGQSMYTIILSTSPHFGLTLEQRRVSLDFHPSEQVVHIAYGPGRPEKEEQVALTNALPIVLHYLQRLWSETKPDVRMPEGLKTT